MGVQERRAREREARRRAVLDATRTLLAEHGFQGTTTRQIAMRCELSEAALFFYFQSKDEIFSSLLLEGIAFMEQGLEAVAAETGSVPRMLARLWRFFAEMRKVHPEFFHVFSYLAHPRSTATVSSEVKAELARRSGDNFRRLAELLRPVAGRDARIAADLVWAAFVGLTVLRDSRHNLGAPAHPTDAELRRALGKLLDGIASPAPRSKRA